MTTLPQMTYRFELSNFKMPTIFLSEIGKIILKHDIKMAKRQCKKEMQIARKQPHSQLKIIKLSNMIKNDSNGPPVNHTSLSLCSFAV